MIVASLAYVYLRVSLVQRRDIGRARGDGHVSLQHMGARVQLSLA